eukprot:TRINITY_DN5042_c0_g1_i1.p1 TRINITY_DN5042_c0_g1~~TRINITY_DN5042_c0_g1_i1.p1  ORF type:complete len:230 (+),score=62.74 TRINITY_DN5042_c0_g1_i1:15-704(+)
MEQDNSASSTNNENETEEVKVEESSNKVEEVVDEEDCEEILTPGEIERRLKESEVLKEEGNEFYKQGLITQAIDKYSKAIEVAPKKHVKTSVYYGNRAAAHLAQEKYEEVVADCDIALSLDPTYTKVLFRRAQANHRLEEYRKAYDDYKKIQELQPDSNSIVTKALVDLPPLIKKKEEEEKEKMMGELKGLANKFLGLFNLSTDNFETKQDPTSGGYSISFNPNPKQPQ